MALFIGTEQEFNKFIGPCIRNRINVLARAAKRDRGLVCEHCGKEVDELEAAHIHGHDRKTIVHELLRSYRDGEAYRVDLGVFEHELDVAHTPIDNVILFLCPECHRAYDRDGQGEAGFPKAKSSTESVSADVFSTRASSANVDITSSFSMQPGEQNKAYVTRVFTRLYREGRIPEYELNRLCSHDADSEAYRSRTFGFTRPLLVTSDAERFDEHGHPRYYAETCCGRFFLCSQWYRESNAGYNLNKFQQWAERMAR